MSWFTEAPWWQVTLLASYAAIVFVVYLRHFVISFEVKRAQFLTLASPRMSGKPPMVSILVPAKDEAGQIENCLRSLCTQDYPNFEILVVDDRSSDDTAAIVTRCAQQDPRIRLLRIHELPAGWTGKTHALHQCQQQARGEWLFFVDADTQMHPSCLSKLLCDCVTHGAEMETLVPALVSDSYWVSVIQPTALMLMMLLFRPSRVNDPSLKNKGYANGQFILIRKDKYRSMGGHEAVRTQVVEDVHLGRNALAHGLEVRVVSAPQLAACKMYATVKQLINGWNRIYYCMVDSGVGRLWGLAGMLLVFSVLPYAVLLAAGAALAGGASSVIVQAAFALAIAHELGQWTLYGRFFLNSGISLRFLPARILGVFVMLYVLGKTIRTCRTHEVSWRGTTYTAQLRQSGETAREAA
jgi:glycosyltransferase involved in cell wall biosynthesis